MPNMVLVIAFVNMSVMFLMTYCNLQTYTLFSSEKRILFYSCIHEASIIKHACPCNKYPFIPNLYKVKTGFTG